MNRLVFGTAGIGLPYGLPRSGASVAELPGEDAVAVLLRMAQDDGIRRFDTAPSYGAAEERLGRFLDPDTEVWTKLGPFDPDGTMVQRCLVSIEASLERLRRERLGLLQWHNWKAELLDDAEFRDCWETLREDERIGALGATTYGCEDAREAVASGLFEVVQLEWNLLNQGVLDSVRDVASRDDVSIALRSVFLQGVLTARGEQLPRGLERLQGPREALVELARDWEMDLATLALRAALDQTGVSAVVVGVGEEPALLNAVQVARSAPLPSHYLDAIKAFDLEGAPVADPRTWGALVS